MTEKSRARRRGQSDREEVSPGQERTCAPDIRHTAIGELRIRVSGGAQPRVTYVECDTFLRSFDPTREERDLLDSHAVFP